MKKFAFKVKINWLPTIPPLEFEGEQLAENEADAKSEIIDFYMVDLDLTDENDIEFEHLTEIENG